MWTNSTNAALSTARGARKRRRALALLAVGVGLLPGAAGCGSKNANASDPDPNYYKGPVFHGRNAKVNAPSAAPHGA